MLRLLGKLILFLIKWAFVLALTITLIVFGIKLGIYLFGTYPKTCFAALFILVVLAGFARKNEKDLVIKYFYQKQVGSVEDIQNHTKLEKSKINEFLEELLKDNKVVLLFSSPDVYKWTEDREYPEGMISREITL